MLHSQWNTSYDMVDRTCCDEAAQIHGGIERLVWSKKDRELPNIMDDHRYTGVLARFLGCYRAFIKCESRPVRLDDGDEETSSAWC